MIIRQMQRYTGLGDGPGYFVRAVRGGITNFLAIAGLVSIVFGLMYRFGAREIPHLLAGHLLAGRLAAGHLAAGRVTARGASPAELSSLNGSRATVLLAAGAISLLVAWLIRPRKRS